MKEYIGFGKILKSAPKNSNFRSSKIFFLIQDLHIGMFVDRNKGDPRTF